MDKHNEVKGTEENKKKKKKVAALHRSSYTQIPSSIHIWRLICLLDLSATSSIIFTWATRKWLRTMLEHSTNHRKTQHHASTNQSLFGVPIPCSSKFILEFLIPDFFSISNVDFHDSSIVAISHIPSSSRATAQKSSPPLTPTCGINSYNPQVLGFHHYFLNS